jgi:hypothetical protein
MTTLYAANNIADNIHPLIFIAFVVFIAGVFLLMNRLEFVNNVRAEFAPFRTCRSATRRGYIYVFRGRGEDKRLVKIGHAKDAVGRLKAHRTANPHGIDLLYVIPAKDRIAAERYIHNRFKAYRYLAAGGSEWFVNHRELRMFCAALNDEKLRQRYQEELG